MCIPSIGFIDRFLDVAIKEEKGDLGTKSELGLKKRIQRERKGGTRVCSFGEEWRDGGRDVGEAPLQGSRIFGLKFLGEGK